MLASLIGVMFGANSIEVFTIGLFAPQLSASFGWTLQQVLLSFTIATISMISSLSIVGIAVDKFGPRIIALIGVVGFSLPFASLFWLTDSLWHLYIVFAVASFFGGGSLPVVWTRMIAKWFDRRLGLAIGSALLGIGLSGAVLKPLVGFLISHWGWRVAYLVVGLLPLVIALPIIFVWFRAPKDEAGHKPITVENEEGTSLSGALRDWRFWVLGVGFMPIGGCSAALIANMESILKVSQIDPSSIVGLVTLIGVSLLVGRAVGGWLLDRMRASVLGAVLVAGLAVACLILQIVPMTHTWALLAVCLIGFGTGVESDVAAYIAVRMFGPRSYGKIGSCITLFSYGSAAVVPLFFAHAFDHAGNYSGALAVASFALIISALMLLSIGRADPSRWMSRSAA